jgi:hypothetical protein
MVLPQAPGQAHRRLDRQAHFVLARALISQGKWEQGRQALQTLHRLQPGNRATTLYSRRAGLGL